MMREGREEGEGNRVFPAVGTGIFATKFSAMGEGASVHSEN